MPARILLTTPYGNGSFSPSAIPPGYPRVPVELQLYDHKRTLLP